jgi:hypothetical protein
MEVHHILKYIHVPSGGIALITGLFAILTKKRSGSHTLNGRIYFASMLIVFVTSIVLSILINSLILLVIGMFSFHMAACGYRSMQQIKKNLQKTLLPDLLAIGFGIVITLILLIIGGLLFYKGNAFAIVLLVFSITSFLNTRNFYKISISTKQIEKLKAHIGFMSGSYIAAFTAFLVNNGNWFHFPQWILWLIPTLIGTPLIIYATKRIEKNQY